MKLQSRQNPKIRFAMQLRDSASFRKEMGAFGVEGSREINCALNGGFEALAFFYCETLLSDFGRRVFSRLKTLLPEAKVDEISESLFSKIAVRERADGVFVIFKRPVLALDAAFGSRTPTLLLIVESIEKPGNLGALMRVADGAGIQGILLVGKTVDPFGPNVIRASLGMVFSFPVVESTNDLALAFCKKQGLRVIASLPGAKAPFWSEELKGQLALVLGSEAEGLSSFWTKCADLCVRIPMLGEADSLNLSVAGAVLLYECARQRSHAGPG